jgi:hypothetical protein
MSRRKSMNVTWFVQSRCRGVAPDSFRLKVQHRRELFLDVLDVVIDLLARQQLPLLRLAARITDAPGRTAGESNRMVPGDLKSPQPKQRDEIPHVQ